MNLINCPRRQEVMSRFSGWIYFCPLRLRNGSFYSHISAESLPKTHPYPETFLEIHLNAATGRSKRQKDETLQNHEGVSFVFLKRFCRLVCIFAREPKPKVEKKQKIYPKKRRHYQPFATHYQNQPLQLLSYYRLLSSVFYSINRF